jgi:hypothetical protein
MHSWKVKTSIPDELLLALHQHQPRAHLSVACTRIDQTALPSAQLRGLYVSIPCSDIITPSSVAPFDELRRLLQQLRNIRALSIDVHQDVKLRETADQILEDVFPRYTRTAMTGREMSNFIKSDCTTSGAAVPTDEAHKVQLPLHSTDRLPPLEQLSLLARTYEFDHAHCLRLLQCMDWTKLRRLTLGPSNPAVFFKTFTGNVPLLKSLSFSYQVSEFHQPRYITLPNYPVLDLTACSGFISTLDKLKELVIRCSVLDFSDPFWHALATSHGERLQHLTLSSQFEGLDAPIYKSWMGDFLGCFTRLRTLDIALRPSDGNGTCARCKHVLVREQE